MRNNRKLMFGFALVAALIVGFIIGLFIEYPKIDNSQLSGTIGRVSNYRNTKATEADIELKNDLLTDTILQKNMSAYMSFYYSKSLEFAKTISFATEQAKAEEAFAAQHATQIDELEQYGAFLENSREDLLLASVVSQSVEESSPELLRNAIAQANNIIAQMNHRNSTVIAFIEELDAYLQKTGSDANEDLSRAHDLLVYNQITASLATSDKVMMKYFDKKQLYAKDVQSTPVDVKSSMVKDLENLSMFYDTEKLGGIGAFDAEKLGITTGGFDAEKLASFWDVEQLGVIMFDAEQLGVFVADTEKLGFHDTEKLGTGFTDAEILGVGHSFPVFDSEKLGSLPFLDAENLGWGTPRP
ncbi:MAG: hypothetical protein PHZ13_08725 [bacterium]|nr:hypothetical protein [bacterium]MDD3968811.1 hypothetical protein [Proteiniphilum sp.]MDD4459891.1 hypothetical protein [Proteiniphilum sp.]